MYTEGVFATNTYNGRIGTSRHPLVPCFTSAAVMFTLWSLFLLRFPILMYIPVSEPASVSLQSGTNAQTHNATSSKYKLRCKGFSSRMLSTTQQYYDAYEVA